MRIESQDIDNIREQADIVDIIGRYIPVEKSGNSFKAVCPFHDDHNPSLHISPSKKMYKCFTCNAGGNVFAFVQNYEKVTFVEAVMKVAKMINYDLKVSQEPISLYEQKYGSLYQVLDEMIKYAHYSLNTQDGKAAKEYLLNRKISEDLIDMFDIGYNPLNNSIYRFLSAKGYQLSDMVKANIVRADSNFNSDVFAGRVVFPIHDEFAHPIGFTARSLDSNAQSKYINTATSELYVKGNFLYNMHRAKSYAKKANKIILVEGVMDVIAFAKAGIFNVVASLGTALTAKQLSLLKQASLNIILAYDGDSAGQAAIYKAGKQAVDAGFNVMVMGNDTTLDPDEIFYQKGKEALEDMVNKPLVWMEFLFKYLQKKYNLEIYSESKEFVSELVQEINKLPDEYDRLNFRHRLENITGFSINNMVQSVTIPKKNVILKQGPKVSDGSLDAQKQILANLVLSFDAIEMFLNDLGYLPNPSCQRLAMMIIDEYRRYQYVDIAKMYDLTDDSEVKELILSVSDNLFSKSYDADQLLGAIKRVKIEALEQRIKELRRQVKSLSSLALKQDVLKQLDTNYRELRKLYDEEK